MDLTVFATNESSINEDMNFFGISPGPETLLNFTFFHKFGKMHKTFFNVTKFDVGMQSGKIATYDNWSYDSKLIF
jgi:hypothetical protein